MKKILLLSTILLLNSCNSTKTVNDAPKINRFWELTEFNGFEKQYLTKTKAYLNLKNENSASAKMGCNGMTLTYSVKSNSSIEFSREITATRMYCEDMKLEHEFTKTISKMTSYSIKGNQLILSNAAQQKMIFIASE